MILAVTFKPRDAERAIVAEAVGNIAKIRYLADFDDPGRRDVLSRADVMLARNPGNELRPDEFSLVHNARLIQFLSAGVDHLPVNALPANVPMAKNAGAYAEPMAEHALAMALAAAKRLPIEHRHAGMR
jgi:glycerate dehydrogenase